MSQNLMQKKIIGLIFEEQKKMFKKDYRYEGWRDYTLNEVDIMLPIFKSFKKYVLKNWYIMLTMIEMIQITITIN